jgi:hypothetical protein
MDFLENGIIRDVVGDADETQADEYVDSGFISEV